MNLTRSSRALIFVLCLSLAVPPVAMAQVGASVARADDSAKAGARGAANATAANVTATAANATAANAITANAITANATNANATTANAATATAPTATATAATATTTTVPASPPANLADGVFGVYGGAESRFANRPGEMSGLRAPLSSVQLPDLGDGSDGTLSPQAERTLGERMMREVRADPDYLDDWLMRDYLDSIATKLSAAAATQYLGGYRPDFDLFAVRDPQINAFSMPGGFIGVNTGLISATQTESELASVIGHEMGHVLQRHIARMIGAQKKSGYAALAAMLAGLLAGVMARSGDLGMGIAMGGQAFAVDNQLKFSRAAEHEADRVGFQMLAAAGYDPYAMTAFFARLDRLTMSDNGVPPYARTHPLTVERIADMEDRARRVPYRQPRQSPEYAFVRARARVLQVNYASDYREVASRLKTEISDQTALNPAANWYGVALAQSLLGDYDAANDALAKSRRLFEGEEANAAVASAQARQELKSIGGADAASGARGSKAQRGAASSAKAAASVDAGLNLATDGARSAQTRHAPAVTDARTNGVALSEGMSSLLGSSAHDVLSFSGSGNRASNPNNPLNVKSAANTGGATLANGTNRANNPNNPNAKSPKTANVSTAEKDSSSHQNNPSETNRAGAATTTDANSNSRHTTASNTPTSKNTIPLPPVHVTSTSIPRQSPQPAAPPQPPAPATPRSTPSLDVLAADIARRAGRNDDAIRLAEIAQKRWPDSHAAIDIHLQALLSAHRYADAQSLARQETRADPLRPDWWLYLAQASAGLNDPLSQHQAMAEKFALDGAWPSAIRQLKEARDLKTASFYDLSTISARLRDFETRYKEEREEEKNS
ncbi:M48 family metalloprotease [Caballeronia sp. LP006]|nr:M48 family metalloprotease [Caballeronia sp. LP006]